MTNQNGIYEVTEIDKNTFLINEKLSTMFVLKGKKSALVIDCGTGVGDFKSVVNDLVGDLPYILVATHSHVDHIGGRGQFDDIYLTSTDSKYIKSVNMLYRRFYTAVMLLTGVKVKNKKFTPVIKEPTVHILSEGDIIDLGERTLRVIETPGHTVGSLSLLDETNRTLFVGDVANEFLFMWMPHSESIDGLIPTLSRLSDMDGYDTVWASHHIQPIHRDDIRSYLKGAKHLARRKNMILPLVLCQKFEGNRIIYRANHIH